MTAPPPLPEGLHATLLSVQELNKLPTCFDLGIGITFLLYFRSVTHFRRLLFSILPSYSNPTYITFGLTVKSILNTDFEYAMGKQVRMKRYWFVGESNSKA